MALPAEDSLPYRPVQRSADRRMCRYSLTMQFHYNCFKEMIYIHNILRAMTPRQGLKLKNVPELSLSSKQKTRRRIFIAMGGAIYPELLFH